MDIAHEGAVVVVSCPSSSIRRGGTVGYAAKSFVVAVSGHACAWRDCSNSCPSETPVVDDVSCSARVWEFARRAGDKVMFVLATKVAGKLFCRFREKERDSRCGVGHRWGGR